MTFIKETLQEATDEMEDWSRERLILGERGEMSNRERAIRVYLALVLAVPFANLVLTSSPTAGRALVALVSFGASFLVGWRAGYETLHVGDRDREPVEERDGEPLADASAGEGSS